ncbi:MULTISPECIES: SusC/RagA family TonB-linked outer membrane protein [unclassified Sphingobacterium]|uniref:SusC/RagA family TonB-linked outer membrane protein n=1 Tax=unclassified Sphingobacterium TaxID=2609468 RepID=UPI00104EF78E|nr:MULTISPECIES: SusC/RagA family TonB-linked outer membrane protein [unclassified Sphingobacterium]MCS3553392.1 TonB-linked SusC/RagA family outer membrane protein [Sphingobacterium sp. JUb21]TCR09398.1 TonB-linked SusC/RagA family outer membrane protein [Sphingobacterium sp. JUb20]
MKKILPIFLFFLMSCNLLFAQVTNITGTIKDDKGGVLPGITVSEKGTTNQAATGSDGVFTLKVQKLPTTIVVRGIGFKSKEQQVQSEKGISIVLATDNSALDEVVVVGYQRQSAKKSTGAVQVISGKTIEDLPAPSFESLLQGRVAGVNIQNFTGEPGARNTFTIRGNSTISPDLNAEVDLANTMSSPLYIIDGMPLSVTDLANAGATGTNYVAGINVNDIESIVIQKDAAGTAVWGSRGANGVIVIKTKQGRSGKPQVRVSYYKGITERPQLQRTLGGATERRAKMDILSQYANWSQMRGFNQPLTDSLNPSYNNATDWQDLFYTSGNIDNADASISGGNEAVNYRVSAGYYNEDGVVRNTGFKRYSLRGNFSFTLSPIVKSDLMFSTARINRKRGLGRGIDEVVPVNQGSMPSSFVGLGQTDYDLFYGQYDKLKDDNQTDNLNIFSKTYVDIIKGLQYSLEASAQVNLDKRSQFQPKELNKGVNYAASNGRNAYTYNLANILNYNKTFNEKHSIILTAMQSFQYDKQLTDNITAYNLPTDDIKVIQGVAQKDLYANSNILEAGLLSYLGQISYDYKSKYIVNASWRADASSRFGKDTKWGYFPAVSAAWIASDENFLKNSSWINLLKFRGSWGLSGILPTDFYAPFNMWTTSSDTYNGNTFSYPSFTKPLTLNNLTWNKSEQTNIGFDLFTFDNRLNITFDAYRKITKDPIMAFPFPYYTGYTKLSFNVPMTIYNEGIDLTIATHNLSKESKLQWNTNFNLTFNKNRIGSLPFGDRSFYADSRGYNQQLMYTVGSPIYQWAQMKYEGVYENQGQIPVNPITGLPLTYFKGNTAIKPGFPIWNDVNQDWDVWSDEDKGAADGDLVLTGNPNPKFTGGLYNEFIYKSFSFSMLNTFTLGRDIINNLKSNQYNTIGGNLTNFTNNRLPDLEGVNYWTPEKAKDPNYVADFPSIAPFGGYFYQFLPFSTMFNENGSYFKIKTISMGYILPKQIVDRMKIGARVIRFYAMLDNVHTFQKASVPDAELVSPQGEYSGGAYPLPKKYTIGLEVNF